MPLGGGWWMEQPRDRGSGHAAVLAELLLVECGARHPAAAQARGVLCLERMRRKAEDQPPPPPSGESGGGSGSTPAMEAFYCESCSRDYAYCQQVQPCVRGTIDLTVAPSPQQPLAQQLLHMAQPPPPAQQGEGKRQRHSNSGGGGGAGEGSVTLTLSEKLGRVCMLLGIERGARPMPEVLREANAMMGLASSGTLPLQADRLLAEIG